MVERFTGERLCFVCKEEEAWFSCRDCDTTARDFCYGCWDQHHSSRIQKSHSYLNFTKYPLPLPQEPKCEKHKARQLELACFKCKNLLCIECLLKDNCPSSPGGTGKHESERTETLAEAKREEIERSLLVSSTRTAEGNVFSGELNLLERKSSDQQERLERDVKMLCKDLLEKGAVHFKSVRETIAGSRKKVSEYMANQERFSTEAKELLSRSSDVEVYLQAPAVVESLSAPFDLILPTIPTVEFKPSIAVVALVTSPTPQADGAGPTTTTQGEGAESATPQGEGAGSTTAPQEEGAKSTTTPQEERAGSKRGSTESSIIETPGQCLSMDGSLWILADRCTVESPVGPIVVEAFGPPGLYSTGPDGERVKVSNDGVDYQSVCIGMDGKIVYTLALGKNTIMMYSTMNGRLVRISEVVVKGAKGLAHVRASPCTGRLVVTDLSFPRLTIHSPNCSLLRIVGPKLAGDIILRYVVAAGWSPCEEYIYMIDWGKDRTDGTVMKLSLTEPTKLVWKKSLRGLTPVKVFAFDQKVYIAHGKGSKITALSPDEGAILKVIPCPGTVREVKPAANGKLELVYY